MVVHMGQDKPTYRESMGTSTLCSLKSQLIGRGSSRIYVKYEKIVESDTKPIESDTKHVENVLEYAEKTMCYVEITVIQ